MADIFCYFMYCFLKETATTEIYTYGHTLSLHALFRSMALAGRVQKRSYRVYCMLGDGELGEGQIWEAAMSASHYQLQGLVAIVDRNQLCLDGKTEAVMGVEPIDERFRPFGWEVPRFAEIGRASCRERGCQSV